MRKFLGQHFLTNARALDKIVNSIPLKGGDLVIEIGPGEGALTKPLRGKVKVAGAHLIAIEKDRRLALKLYQGLAKENDELEVVDGDALEKIEALSRRQGNYHIVGNIPYYITGRLLRIISELENKPISSTLTIQEEVANKITSQKGASNLLSAITGAWADSQILMHLKSEDFNPPPKVRSAIIQLITRKDAPNAEELLKYFAFLRAAFKQARKTLLNNLSESYKDIDKVKILKFLASQELTEKTRAKELDDKELMRLFSAFDLFHRSSSRKS
jgi:16S rRNA (adenine1518-N6/adenine1519-N6)-dimethyltransferase